MSITDQAHAYLGFLEPKDFERMPPAQRQRFADLCRHVALLAEPPVQRPRSGVLYDLRVGVRPD